MLSREVFHVTNVPIINILVFGPISHICHFSIHIYYLIFQFNAKIFIYKIKVNLRLFQQQARKLYDIVIH